MGRRHGMGRARNCIARQAKTKYRDDAVRYAKKAGTEGWFDQEKIGHYQYYPFMNAGHFRLYELVDAGERRGWRGTIASRLNIA